MGMLLRGVRPEVRPMGCELNLQFPDHEHVIVHFEGETTAALGFANPLGPKDRQDIQWYLEVYGALSLADPDESEARRVAAQLPAWGKALFAAVFADRAAERLFNRFQDSQDEARLLSISAEHPAPRRTCPFPGESNTAVTPPALLDKPVTTRPLRGAGRFSPDRIRSLTETFHAR